MGREQHRYLGSFIACGVGMGVVIAWVLLGKPEEGWLSPPVALVGVPCAIGFVVLGVLVVAAYARALRYSLHRRAGDSRVVSNGVPKVVVERDDVRSSGLIMSAADVEQLSRLEAVIRKPLEQR
jgi:hypothetical protein